MKKKTKTIDLEKLFGIKVEEPFCVEIAHDMLTDEEARETVQKNLCNPYILHANNLLTDKEGYPAHSVLGWLTMGWLTVKREPLSVSNFTGKYFFIREDGSIGFRKNKKTWFDIMNVLIGNVFFNREEIGEKEIANMHKIYLLLLDGGIGQFSPTTEKTPKLLDVSDENLKGTLAHIFKNNQTHIE